MPTGYRVRSLEPSARPDASMDLLREVTEHSLDPDYRVPAPGRTQRRHPITLAVVLGLAGVMVGLSVAQTSTQAPAAEVERRELVQRIREQTEVVDARREQAAELDAEIAELRSGRLAHDGTDRELEAEVAGAELEAAGTPVRGPGMVVVVDDAASGEKDTAVLDRDLQELANGLWVAGAEAVSVNGHRLSSRTAIRGAGEAITVDYRSLTRPYRIEAIGDPQTLQARWLQTPAAGLWSHLRTKYGMRYEMSVHQELLLRGDTHATLRHVRPQR